MSKLHLFPDGDDHDGDKLNINKTYADRYDNWRHLEELQKLKDRYGDVEDDGDTNSSSSEEPAVSVINIIDGGHRVVWSVEHEKDFLRTLSALKTHDPKLYLGQKFFTAEDKGTSSGGIVKSKKKDAPMFLKDYERKFVLEKGGVISEDEEETKISNHGYFKQQDSIKSELKAVLAQQDDDDTEPLLRQRVKTEDEMEGISLFKDQQCICLLSKYLNKVFQKSEEDQYYEWLKGQRDDLPAAEELKGLKEAWNDTNLDEGEKFLRDYLLNKKYDVEGDDGVPSYEEIVMVEKDEEELERETDFERKYNFRYEEPDQDFIKHYPRTVQQSLRKKDERRKQKRDAYKERKKLEKQARKEEIKELRALKKKEIEEKLKKLKKLAGDDDLPLNVDDLEADFDPTVYDKRMQEVFSVKYYEKTLEENEEKPVFSDTSDLSTDDSDYDNLEVHKEQKEHRINSISEDNNDEDSEKKLSRKKRKRNSRFLEVVLKEKPLFNPEEKSFEEYFNEYYALDYEDIIADGLITKFKYRSVPANDFGITIDELLNADDRQLNAWASLKKATAYRSEAEEFYDIKAYRKKAMNLQKKKRIFSTDFGGQEIMLALFDNLAHTCGQRKKSKKLIGDANGNEPMHEMTKVPTKESSRNFLSANSTEASSAVMQEVAELEMCGECKSGFQRAQSNHSKNPCNDRKRNHSAFDQFNSTIDFDDGRLRAYGINPKKYRNKLFHQQKNGRRDAKKYE